MNLTSSTYRFRAQSGGDDEEEAPLKSPSDTPGPEAGDYTPPPDVDVPGESEGIDNAQL